MEYEPQELVVIYNGETIHGETCETCQSPRVVEYDVENVPFCRQCWDSWQAGAAAIGSPGRQRKPA